MGESGNHCKSTEQGCESAQVKIGQVGPVKRHEDTGRKHGSNSNAEHGLLFCKGCGRDEQVFF